MIEGDVGLHLVTAAVLGPQTNFGNGWTWPFITWGAQIDASSIPSLSLFTVDGPTTAPLGPVTESTQGSWFVQGTCTNCENDCETVWDVEVPRRDYAAVKGDSLSLEWVEPIIWDARRNLYESLLMRPEIAEGDSILTDFLSDFEADGIGLLSEVGKLVNDGCDICTTVYAEFNDLRLVRDTMMQNLITNDSSLFTGISTQDSLDLLTANETIMVNLFSVTNAIDSLHIEINQSLNDNIKNAEKLNNEAYNSLTKTIEFNEYNVNAIHFDIILNKRTVLDSSQVAIITEIAWQCSAEGGKAVLRARTIYNEFVNDSIYFDDDSLCASTNHRIAQTKDKNSKINDFAFILPNPANDYVFLNYSITGTQLPTYHIHDISGRLIIENELSTMSGNKSIDVSKLNSGMYYFSITNNNKFIVNKKNHNIAMKQIGIILAIFWLNLRKF